MFQQKLDKRFSGRFALRDRARCKKRLNMCWLRFFLRTLVLVGAATLPASSFAESIGLFFDTDCTKCGATLPVGSQTTLYLSAVREGPWENYPLIGAEFRVVGLPSEWQVSWVPHPQARFSIGNPFAEGVDIAFDSDPGIEGSCINLFTCTVTATSFVENVYLDVVAHTNPGWNVGACPVLVCTTGREPGECLFCVATTQCIINGPSCSVAVESRLWSEVKALYR